MSTPTFDPAQQWWTTYDNIIFLAGYMAEMDYSAVNMADMVEKPWKFTDIYEEAREYEASEVEEVDLDITEAEADEESDASQHLFDQFRTGFDEGRPSS